MRLWQSLLLAPLLAVLVGVGACNTESQTQNQPTPTPHVDTPYLSPQEAISIAKEHSVASPQNMLEKEASIYARLGGSQGWNAKYTGDKKWSVELNIHYESGEITVHRWTVFETNLTAVYIGAYKGN